MQPSSLAASLTSNALSALTSLAAGGGGNSPHPPTKKRRAKRTEEERIDYLRADPYVAQFEPYR